MRILVAAAGSHGDVLPFIGLCRALQARGAEVILHASAYFGPLATAAGVRLRPLGTAADHIELLRDPDLAHPIRGHGAIATAIERYLPVLYQSLRADIDPGHTLVIGSVLAFPARLLRDTHGIPCVIVHLAPATLRSSFDTPRMTRMDPAPLLPRWSKSLLFRAIDRWILDPLYGAPLNRYRATLGLPPVRGVLGTWLNDTDLLLALFPAWFAAPQPDWPVNLRQVGFPLHDQDASQGAVSAPGGEGSGSASPVLRFLDDGAPPFAFTAGTATAASAQFFAASVEACRRLGRRGILLSHRPEPIPARLPAGVVHFRYVPFGQLLPRVAALVHHGGIGTTSQALRAGVPQLVRPMAYDQLDNSRRVRQLGVAREIAPARYDGESAARILGALEGDERIRERCRHWARKSSAADALDRSCDLILEAFAALR